MKRSINEIESTLRRIKERLNNSNSHGEKRAGGAVFVIPESKFNTYKSPLILNIKEEGVLI